MERAIARELGLASIPSTNDRSIFRVPREVGEQIELPAREVDRLPAARHLPGRQIDHHLAEGEEPADGAHGRLGFTTPPAAPLDGVGRFDDVEPLPVEGALDEVPHRCIILGDQHLHGSHLRQRPAPPSSRRYCVRSRRQLPHHGMP